MPSRPHSRELSALSIFLPTIAALVIVRSQWRSYPIGGKTAIGAHVPLPSSTDQTEQACSPTACTTVSDLTGPITSLPTVSATIVTIARAPTVGAPSTTGDRRCCPRRGIISQRLRSSSIRMDRSKPKARETSVSRSSHAHTAPYLRGPQESIIESHEDPVALQRRGV